MTVTAEGYGHALRPDIPTPHAGMEISELTRARKMVAERIVQLVRMHPELQGTDGQLNEVISEVGNETGWEVADIYSALSYSERYLSLSADRLSGAVRVIEEKTP